MSQVYVKNSKLLSNSFWATVSTLSLAIAQILRLSILAHFLEKSDFGIVAVLTFILGLTFTFSDLGFSVAVMHKRDIKRDEFSSLFWIQLGVFFLIYLIAISLSHFISTFYETPEIEQLLPLVLLDIIIQGIGKLYDTLLQKNFLFKTIAIRNLVSSTLSLIVAFELAYLGFGVLSLIVSTLFQSAMLNFWNLIVGQKQIKLSLTLSINQILPLAKMGINQTGTQIVDYISAKLDILIIGKILGMESLGIYNLAKELVMKEVVFTNTIVNKVVLPYFSVIQSNNYQIRYNYCRLLKVVSLINFAISLIFISLSAQIVNILYGESYSEVAPILSILSLWAMILCLGNPIGNVVVAKGRTDISLKYTIIRLIIYTPLTFMFCKIGLYTLSFGQIALGLISLILSWYMILFKLIELPITYFMKSFSYQGIVTLALSILGYYLAKSNFFGINNMVIQFLVYGGVVISLYSIILFPAIKGVLNNFLILKEMKQ